MEKLEDIKATLEELEPTLADHVFVVCAREERNGRTLHVAITERLHRRARRGRVWKSKQLLTALKNASYGFDEQHARSRGGADGLFLLDRSFRPVNTMMTKIFDRFLDATGATRDEVAAIARELGAPASALRAARLVSHHMRLLGVLWQADDADWLVLVDYDDEA